MSATTRREPPLCPGAGEKERDMTTSRIIPGIVALVFMVGGPVAAQEPIKTCKPVASDIYYVDSGTVITEVHPGSNGGNGYQLNILGTAVDKLQVVKEPYMTSVSPISNYTGPTAAKWAIFFEPKMGRTLSSVRLSAPECTGRLVREHRLSSSVKLLDE